MNRPFSIYPKLHAESRCSIVLSARGTISGGGGINTGDKGGRCKVEVRKEARAVLIIHAKNRYGRGK